VRPFFAQALWLLLALAAVAIAVSAAIAGVEGTIGALAGAGLAILDMGLLAAAAAMLARRTGTAGVARISHHPSATAADAPAVSGRSSRHNPQRYINTASGCSGPGGPTQQGLDDFATKPGEKCGLASLGILLALKFPILGGVLYLLVVPLAVEPVGLALGFGALPAALVIGTLAGRLPLTVSVQHPRSLG